MENTGEVDGPWAVASDTLIGELLAVAEANAKYGDTDAYIDISLQIFDICDMLDIAEYAVQTYPTITGRSVLDILLEALTRNTSLTDVTELYNRLMEL